MAMQLIIALSYLFCINKCALVDPQCHLEPSPGNVGNWKLKSQRNIKVISSVSQDVIKNFGGNPAHCIPRTANTLVHSKEPAT